MDVSGKISDMKNKLGTDAKSWRDDISFKALGQMFLLSMCINLIIEILGQFKYGGLFEAFVTIAHNPLVFLYNSFIIMVTLSVGLLFKQSEFIISLLSIIWVSLGIVNCILLACRVTPFSAAELGLLDAAIGVMRSYVSVGIVVAVVAALALIVGAVFICWKKSKIKEYVNLVSSIVVVVVLIILLRVFTYAGLATNIISTKLPNLSECYVEYGFVYCFSNSVINTGINKPKDYSEEKVTEIKDSVEEKLGNTAMPGATASQEVVNADKEKVTLDKDKLPNIIFLQLESFFDITKVDRLEFSKDPIPFFRQCINNYSSGYLSVPSVGAGTANTEFEIITGMNLDFFGPGEYPYKTVLKEKTCETISYNLKPYGYTTQAMHNNRASFYDRNRVFAQFGFDYFIPMELMDISEYTENGWAKDKFLTDELLKSLKGTKNKDFIYTISVQAHGSYPTEPSMTEYPVKITGGCLTDVEKYATEYYVNQIYEMDIFLQELTAAMTDYKQQTGEDVILVAYGDHLPTLYFEEEELENKNLYQTQYFVWNTMELPVEKENIEAYQLSSRVLETLGIDEGEINAYHQANRQEAVEDNEKYLEDLKVLGYDMFYGDNYFNDGEVMYTETELKFGIENVEISSVFIDQSDSNYLIVKGKNFTKYSAVYINDTMIDSEFLNKNNVRISLDEFEDFEEEPVEITIKQTYAGDLILQTSNSVEYTPKSKDKGVEK